MTISVSPDTFHLVQFDAAVIARVAEAVQASLGLHGDVRIEVDETTPLGRVGAEPGDPPVVHVESGAFEDTRRPRQLSEEAVARSVGRALLRLHDRSTGFVTAPADDDLTLAQAAAWDVYSVGRIDRAGWPQLEQRWRYHFRNRHGFNDAADRVFDRLWSADGLTWDELATLSDQALGATAAR